MATTLSEAAEPEKAEVVTITVEGSDGWFEVVLPATPKEEDE